MLAAACSAATTNDDTRSWFTDGTEHLAPTSKELPGFPLCPISPFLAHSLLTFSHIHTSTSCTSRTQHTVWQTRQPYMPLFKRQFFHQTYRITSRLTPDILRLGFWSWGRPSIMMTFLRLPSWSIVADRDAVRLKWRCVLPHLCLW